MFILKCYANWLLCLYLLANSDYQFWVCVVTATANQCLGQDYVKPIVKPLVGSLAQAWHSQKASCPSPQPLCSHSHDTSHTVFSMIDLQSRGPKIWIKTIWSSANSNRCLIRPHGWQNWPSKHSGKSCSLKDPSVVLVIVSSTQIKTAIQEILGLSSSQS